MKLVLTIVGDQVHQDGKVDVAASYDIELSWYGIGTVPTAMLVLDAAKKAALNKCRKVEDATRPFKYSGNQERRKGID